MKQTETNLEAQIFEDSDENTSNSNNIFSVRNIAIGSAGLVLLAAGGATYYYYYNKSGGTKDELIPKEVEATALNTHNSANTSADSNSSTEPKPAPLNNPNPPSIVPKPKSFSFTLKFNIVRNKATALQSLNLPNLNHVELKGGREYYSIPISSKAQYAEVRAALSSLKDFINLELAPKLKTMNGKFTVSLICEDPSENSTKEFDNGADAYKYVHGIHTNLSRKCQIDYDSLIEDYKEKDVVSATASAPTFRKTIKVIPPLGSRIDINTLKCLKGAQGLSFSRSFGGSLTFVCKSDLFAAIIYLNDIDKDVAKQAADSSIKLNADNMYQLVLAKPDVEPVIKSFKTISDMVKFIKKLNISRVDPSLVGYKIDYDATIMD